MSIFVEAANVRDDHGMCQTFFITCSTNVTSVSVKKSIDLHPDPRCFELSAQVVLPKKKQDLKCDIEGQMFTKITLIMI